MTEHPILFNAEMVRANLAGTKTQTRRLVTPRNSTVNGYPFDKKCAWPWHMLNWKEAEFRTTSIHSDDDPHFSVPLMGEDGKPEKDPDNITRHRVRPKWSVGDILWGRETFCTPTTIGKPAGKVRYRATHKDDGMTYKWRPSIFMPRNLSRLILEITELRGQRLQEITEDDAKAEGVERLSAARFRDYSNGGHTYGDARQSYKTLWDSINKKKAPSASNPLVWAITYKPFEGRAA